MCKRAEEAIHAAFPNGLTPENAAYLAWFVVTEVRDELHDMYEYDYDAYSAFVGWA